MVTYVNIGPYRSGTTSFYNMCCKYKTALNYMYNELKLVDDEFNTNLLELYPRRIECLI